ncbi:peptidase P60 [Sporolactobacillus putidus]|uniref:Peptidase P60 n=1 Tax=Sporolactobacillus putidus TaxID=492735 RepID=A0A917W242_9BACL|nr:peptidase P60 [Sporolactobacillus putidus]
MRRLSLIFMILLITTIGFSTSAEAKEPVPADPGSTAYVDVSVATLWTSSNILRPVDYPSSTNPADPRKWTAALTLAQKLQLSGDNMLETQALLGEKVTILEKQGDWVKVAVNDQPTPRNALGYPGWMPASQLTDNNQFTKKETKPFVIVTSPTTYLYHSPSTKKKDIEISYNTHLPFEAETSSFYKVLKPDGNTAWVLKKDAQKYRFESDIPIPTGQQLVQSAEQFLGLPYLWAGMSGFGFDCSGFTYTIYKAHGITIPRDADPQLHAANGTPVAAEDLQPGDLLFYATNHGKGFAYHCTMYIGNGLMIQSPDSSSSVNISQ